MRFSSIAFSLVVGVAGALPRDDTSSSDGVVKLEARKPQVNNYGDYGDYGSYGSYGEYRDLSVSSPVPPYTVIVPVPLEITRVITTTVGNLSLSPGYTTTATTTITVANLTLTAFPAPTANSTAKSTAPSTFRTLSSNSSVTALPIATANSTFTAVSASWGNFTFSSLPASTGNTTSGTSASITANSTLGPLSTVAPFATGPSSFVTIMMNSTTMPFGNTTGSAAFSGSTGTIVIGIRRGL